MTQQIRLIRPIKKEEYLANIDNIEVVSNWEKISWLAYSDLDISFYRIDIVNGKEKRIDISKESMKIAIEQEWEMRPSL